MKSIHKNTQNVRQHILSSSLTYSICVTGAVTRCNGQVFKIHEIEEHIKAWFHSFSDKEGGRKRRDRARQILWQQFEREASAAAAQGRPMTPYMQTSTLHSTSTQRSTSDPSETVASAVGSAPTQLHQINV